MTLEDVGWATLDWLEELHRLIHMKELTAAERKQYPIASGVIDYFPDAILEISHVSFVGNEQHNPGTPLHWDRSKSTDEANALMRHFKDRGKLDTDGQRHSAKMAWRALALLQKEIEADDANGRIARAAEEGGRKTSIFGS
jgi:hypothetical protein